MKVKDYMSTNVYSVDIYDGLIDAAKMMKEYNIGFLPVKDGEKVVGVLTDRDIVTKGLTTMANMGELICRDIMSDDMISVEEDEDAGKALTFMAENKIRRLLVNREGKFTGVVSIGDLATSQCPDEHVGKTLSKISEN